MTANKIRENTPAVGQPRNPGRPKGSPNKTTAAVKDMILQALNEAHVDGGAAYLKEQAAKNPTAFMSLVGKVLPLDVNANVTTVPAYTVDEWVIPAIDPQVGHA